MHKIYLVHMDNRDGIKQGVPTQRQGPELTPEMQKRKDHLAAMFTVLGLDDAVEVDKRATKLVRRTSELKKLWGDMSSPKVEDEDVKKVTNLGRDFSVRLHLPGNDNTIHHRLGLFILFVLSQKDVESDFSIKELQRKFEGLKVSDEAKTRFRELTESVS